MSDTQNPFSALTPFLDQLKSDAPTPGGGAVAGLLGALAAALSHMVASLTVNKKKYAEVQGEFQEAMPLMEKCLAGFTQLMLDDVAVFDAYMAALKLPKTSEEEKTRRRAAMQDAAREAARVPMETLELAHQTLPLVELAAQKGNRNAVSDAGMAAILIAAAARSAALNVRINLRALPPEEAHRTAERLQDVLTRTLAQAESIEKQVADSL